MCRVRSCFGGPRFRAATVSSAAAGEGEAPAKPSAPAAVGSNCLFMWIESSPVRRAALLRKTLYNVPVMSEVIAVYAKTSREFKCVKRIPDKTSLESLIISSRNQIASRLLQINDLRRL
jgi:hypothetical protein